MFNFLIKIITSSKKYEIDFQQFQFDYIIVLWTILNSVLLKLVLFTKENSCVN